MPKKPIDYSKGLIYRLVCRDIEIKELYVGSTTDWSSRKAKHKSACNNPRDSDRNAYVYQFIRSHGGWSNWDMILIEPFPCENEHELHARERFHIEQLGATLNSCIPTRTHEEYRIENKEAIAAQQKAWKVANAQHIIDSGKQYYAENSATINAKNKVYQEANKAAINARQSEMVLCECGLTLTRSCKSRHIKSKQHTNSMAALVLPAPEVPEVVQAS